MLFQHHYLSAEHADRINGRNALGTEFIAVCVYLCVGGEMIEHSMHASSSDDPTLRLPL